MPASPDVTAAANLVAEAVRQGLLTPGAQTHITAWLTEPRYAEYLPELLEHIDRGDWKQLDNVFWTIIPFGTGGRRGRMYPIGSNAINDRTIGESAQGLANYILSLSQHPARLPSGALSCAIAYDTRHRSRHFAEWCAGIMAANGFTVYFLDDYRATPQLSFAVRHFGCTCGIMVTASHNPPSDNAVKVYWSTGGQVLPPHDAQIIEHVMQCDSIQHIPFDQGLQQGKIQIVTEEIDNAFEQAALKTSWPGPRDCRILFSPLHGVGGFVVPRLLRAAGFENVEVFPAHAKPDGDFPNVPGHVSNPENPRVFDAMIEYAKTTGADLALATDPDCDRMGCACPKTTSPDSPWGTLNGNQLGALLTDFVLSQAKAAGRLKPNSYIIKTLVTTELTRKIAESYGVRCEGNLHVGFKWIAGTIDQCGPDLFLFGTEESHGYLSGQHARDKDGAVACLLMAEMAAYLKAKGLTLHQRLDALLLQHGVFLEDQVNVQMEGSQGMAQMERLMQELRTSPPSKIADVRVATVRDYQNLVIRASDGSTQPLSAPKGNMLILDLAIPGNAVAIRPSGTEPKIKLYLFGAEPVSGAGDLEDAKTRVQNRLTSLKEQLKQWAT
ncbi:MAG: phospho-sugar mutase [Pirellula sp.]|nr:phospho-sugar mutase [Pirellula sp.]